MKKWNPEDVVLERLRFNVPAESLHIGTAPNRGGSLRPVLVRMQRPDGTKLYLNGRKMNLPQVLAKGWRFIPYDDQE